MQFRLGEQHGRFGFREFLVGKLQPVVAALVGTLQLGRPRRHEVVDERRIGPPYATGQQALAPGPVALGHVNQPPGQLLSGAPQATLRDNLAQPARRPPQRQQQAHGEVRAGQHQHQHRYRHFDHVAEKVDQYVSAIAEQEMRGERAEEDGGYAPEPGTHQPSRAASSRNRLSEPLISGRAGSMSSCPISSRSVTALCTACSETSKYRANRFAAASTPARKT